MKKEIVKLQLDFMQGPIWISDVETGEPLTGINIIDNDAKVIELNYKIYELYDKFFDYDSSGIPINKNQEVIRKERINILNLINELKNRLNEINDGSFEIFDLVTRDINDL